MQNELITSTDAISQGIVGLAIVGVFVLLTLEAAHRVLVVMIAAAILWFFTYLTPSFCKRPGKKNRHDFW